MPNTTGLKGFQVKELTQEQVKEIFESELGQLKLAKQFGVGPERIQAIKHSETLEDAYEFAAKAIPKKPRASKAEPKTSATHTLVKTENLEDANVLQVVPTVKQFSSVVLFLAKTYTEKEWNWPQMDVGDWIDTYIYHTLRQHGVTLGYNTQEVKNTEDGSDGS